MLLICEHSQCPAERQGWNFARKFAGFWRELLKSLQFAVWGSSLLPARPQFSLAECQAQADDAHLPSETMPVWSIKNGVLWTWVASARCGERQRVMAGTGSFLLQGITLVLVQRHAQYLPSHGTFLHSKSILMMVQSFYFLFKLFASTSIFGEKSQTPAEQHPVPAAIFSSSPGFHGEV